MRFNQGRFGFLAPVLFSLLFILNQNAKADEAAAAPAATPAAPMEGQGNTMTATGVSELPEVKVTAHGIDQAAAFDQMHDSLNKVNILSQDQINQTPAKTVAQAAEQLPGVGTQHDTSEPRYIDIRGTDSNLNIVTFNETIIPSYDEASRSVDLDAIPAGLFGELQLYKTILPNMDAEGVGGQLNLVPKYANDYPGGLFELKAEGELFPERNQVGGLGDLTWADTYNLGGKTNLGILVTGGYQYSRFGIDDLENAYSDPANKPLVPNSVSDYEFRYYDYERQRAGIGTNINLDLDRDNKLYANLMYSGYDEYRNPVWHTTYSGLDALPGLATVAPDGTITINNAGTSGSAVDVNKSGTDELTQFRTLATGVGGVNNLGGFILDYNANFAYTDQNVPYNYGYSFDDPTMPNGSTLTYNNSTNNGNMPSFNFSGLKGADTNPANFLYQGANNGTSNYQVAQYGGRADGKFDIDLGGGDASTVKFGGAARLQYSTNVNENFTSALSSTPLYLNAFSLTSPSYYPPNNIYNMGPIPDFTQTTNLLNNPNQYQGPFVQTDPNGDKGGDYNNWEDVYAGYAMYTLKSGNMEVMGGARVETTHIQYTWYDSYVIDPTTGDPTKTELPSPVAETGTIDYTNILPSLGFKYTFNPDLITRMNYSQTIARPTQNQYIPSFSLGQALDAQNGDSNIKFEYGNPNLKPMISNNIDFSCELYPQKGAILGVDFFLKDINNYFAQNYTAADGSAGVTDYLNYINIPTSDIYGVEFQYQQQYTMLPGFLSGLGFRGSISFIGSQGEISPGVYGQLPSQSDLIWETGVFYKKGGLTVDVAGNFTGKNLTTIGDPNADNSPNVYYDDYFQVNAKAQYAFTKNFKIYADWNNINNADLRYYQGSPQYPIQNEFYGPSFDGGIDVTF
jgi:TonB-dependent receptor